MYFLKKGLLEKEFDKKILVFIKDKNSFMRLSGVSLVIWNELKKKSEINQIVNFVRREFEVDAAEAKKDVNEFVDKLLDMGLVEKKS